MSFLPVFAIGHSVFTTLGNSSVENMNAIFDYKCGINEINDISLSRIPFWASRLSKLQLLFLKTHFAYVDECTIFEKMCIYAVLNAIQSCEKLNPKETILILSSTKGNIDQLSSSNYSTISLHYSADKISKVLGFCEHKPIVVSNACISGSLALIMGKRLISTKKYKNAVIVGADMLSGFVINGFQSFQAIAPAACRPFDKQRNGINLGEAAACIILSSSSIQQQINGNCAQLCGGGLSNDANHLSGPSRTGLELATAIKKAIKEGNICSKDIGVVNAHGTATIYNDEMEAKALHHAEMQHAQVHSLKSYFGHTLGAAGIIESIIGIMAMQAKIIPASLRYENSGVSQSLNISNAHVNKEYDYFLKTASGFGGCNAALVWKK